MNLKEEQPNCCFYVLAFSVIIVTVLPTKSKYTIQSPWSGFPHRTLLHFISLPKYYCCYYYHLMNAWIILL